jgi:sugar/nucleoside kinase (ribokinase family)
VNQSPPIPASVDVIAIGNAIVDVMAPASEEAIASLDLAKGGMTLVDTDRARQLYDAMGPAREISGGSAANTLAGLAALGAKCAFIGQVADDQLGDVFAHDIRAGGIAFATPARAGDPSTARCLIFVTPDGQRTMNTFLGASQFLPAAALDEDAIAAAKVLGSGRAASGHASRHRCSTQCWSPSRFHAVGRLRHRPPRR